VKARDNPFSVERIEKIRYRPLGTSFEELAERLETMNYRAAIIGPEGSGKTTLLEDLQRRLEAAGIRTKNVFVNDTNRLTRSRRRQLISELGGDEIVLLDGAGAIARLAWLGLKRGILKKAAGLVITAHRPGLLPVLIECSTTPALFRELTTDLLRRGEKVNAGFLDEIYHRHKGNIRTALRELYDTYARLDDCSHDMGPAQPGEP